MSEASKRLKSAMRLRSIGSGADLARLTRQNEVTVRSHLNGTRDVSKRSAEAYSRVLRIDPAWLLYGMGDGPNGESKTAGDLEIERDGPASSSAAYPASNNLPDFRSLPKDLPVLGTAECGDDGAFTLNSGDPIDFVRRPPGLSTSKGIYCIYAEGSSMEPVHEAGDLIFVDPHRPPRPGRDVIVQLKPRKGEEEPRCFLKRLTKRSGTKWVVRQFNPAVEITFDDRDIIAVHLVLKNHELLGI